MLGQKLSAEAGKSPPPTTPGGHIRTSAGTAGAPLGSADHDIAAHPRGPAPAFTSVSTPANGQFPLQFPAPLASPFAHVSQILAGIGQGHPSIGFPQITGENPHLWKTLCEEYFQMFGIQENFWVTMASLNFSGSASVWLQWV